MADDEMPPNPAFQSHIALSISRLESNMRRLMAALLMGAVAIASASATAVADADALTLPSVLVTATRVEAPPFELPASIDRIDAATIRERRMQVHISESLAGVPGLMARDRQNHAQDVQISIRGFGARASFGIRGVRLYVDGIPATMPDGQGQISNVDLGSTESIEILRGPFSALYGNAAGGVIQIFTETGRGAPTLEAGVAGGSDGVLRRSTKLTGASGAFAYVASLSRFVADGYREHSEVDRRIGNLKLDFKPDADTRLSLVANSVALPMANDPLGLSRAQFEADPRGVAQAALSFDTRKTVDQSQAGVIVEKRLNNANALRLMTYAGRRGMTQFQSIPVAPQAGPLHPGGVIVLRREYRGTDLRWTFSPQWEGEALTLVAGLAYDTLVEHRQGFQNFAGTKLGVQGALRRDETNDVINADQYLQAVWRMDERWTLNAGLRRSAVRFVSKDAYIVGPNGDDSGGARYGATLPMLGLMFALNEKLHLYATAGRGFETPTMNELAYQAGGATGPNFALQAASSDSIEAGLKARLNSLGELNLALFQPQTVKEIVTLSSSGGRTTFQNAGGTRRQGLELGWSSLLGKHLRAQAALTLLDATYVDTLHACTVSPCSQVTPVIVAGKRLPGVARSSVQAALAWTPATAWRVGLEARYLSRVFVNDLNSDAAASYLLTDASLGYLARFGAWRLSGFVRIDNLFDSAYVGSVIVNEGNQRFFEPGPGRTWSFGLTASRAF